MYGRTYVVTGGSRGLGLAAARVLMQEGANLAISARNEANLAAVVDDLSHHGRDRIVGIASDLGDAAAAERLVAAAVARFGRLDGALINGSTPPAGSALDTPDALWREAFETIFLGGLRMARATAAAMTSDNDELKGTGGSIAVVLSTSARQPFPGLSVSNGLRPGQAMLVRELADEFGPRGIRINGLMPGRIATDRIFEADARSGQPEMARRRNESMIPLGRYGETAEFGQVAAFILSPMASYVTGTLIAIDGGALRVP